MMLAHPWRFFLSEPELKLAWDLNNSNYIFLLGTLSKTTQMNLKHQECYYAHVLHSMLFSDWITGVYSFCLKWLEDLWMCTFHILRMECSHRKLLPLCNQFLMNSKCVQNKTLVNFHIQLLFAVITHSRVTPK